MLGRDKKISDKEKAELKDIAQQLLERLKDKKFKIIHWADKEQTASAVRVVIKNYLFDKLPYGDRNCQVNLAEPSPGPVPRPSDGEKASVRHWQEEIRQKFQSWLTS